MTDSDRWKQFIIGFILIVIGSVASQMLLLKAGFFHYQHYKVSYNNAGRHTKVFIPQGPPIEGVVSAISFDRFFVKVGKHDLTFLVHNGRPAIPKVGEHVRVSYYQGAPPTAIAVQRLKP